MDLIVDFFLKGYDDINIFFYIVVGLILIGIFIAMSSLFGLTGELFNKGYKNLKNNLEDEVENE